jgi:HEAT repeat protein
MRRLVLTACLLAALAGCGRTPPTLAGGKPVSYWLEAVRGPDARLRKTAVFKLGNVGPGEAAVVPALLGALKDRDAAVRREAILALMKCGPDARDAVPALTDLRQHDRDAQVRAYAARALEKLGRESEPAR